MSVSGGIGLSVRTLREAVGLSLDEAAAVLDRDPAHLQRIEEGTGYASDKMLTNISGGLAQWAVDGSPTPVLATEKDTTDMRTRTWTIRPCKRHGCIESSHEWVDGEQDSMCICANSPVLLEGRHSELITGYYCEGSEAWEAYAEIEFPEALEGHSGLTNLERLARAFKEVQDRCDELNAFGQKATTAKLGDDDE